MKYESFGKLFVDLFRNPPKTDFRDKFATVYNAGDGAKCARQLGYKATKTKPSNPPDIYGIFRMSFGRMLERGLIYELFNKLAPHGYSVLSTQSQLGEYPADEQEPMWHGYSDLLMLQNDTKKRFIVEAKTKVGNSANYTYSEWLRNGPRPDSEWGYAQQLGLYLKKAYQDTKDDDHPIVDGILLYLLYGDSVADIIQMHCVYQPDNNSVRFTECISGNIPEFNCALHDVIPLETVSARWRRVTECLHSGKLPEPDYVRKYDVNTCANESQAAIKGAIAGQRLLGDVHCKYCDYRDKCSSDLGISLEYSDSELNILQSYVKEKKVKK